MNALFYSGSVTQENRQAEKEKPGAMSGFSQVVGITPLWSFSAQCVSETVKAFGTIVNGIRWTGQLFAQKSNRF